MSQEVDARSSEVTLGEFDMQLVSLQPSCLTRVEYARGVHRPSYYRSARRLDISRTTCQDTGPKLYSSLLGIQVGRYRVQMVERSTRTIRNEFGMLS
jgi:hypothetical protein